MSLNLAEVRQVQAGGQGGDGKESFISRPTVSKVPFPQHPPQESQGTVLSSPGQASPASRPWLLLRSAPRNFQTPV